MIGSLDVGRPDPGHAGERIRHAIHGVITAAQQHATKQA
jgi:hypothetical protein